MLSHKAIASAYSEAGMDADADTDRDVHSMLHRDDRSDDSLSQSSFPDMSDQPERANGNSSSLKLKYPPAATGTVSNILGKDYVRSQPSSRKSPEATKPLKLDPALLPMSVLGVDEDKVQTKTDRLHKEMEDFLFRMLGEGFQLERDLIQDVLSKCGYDMQKSMDKLFDYSASAMEKRTRIRHETTQKDKDSYSRAGGLGQQKKIQHTGSQGFRVSGTVEDKHNLQKEVLAALFTSERYEDSLGSAAKEKSAACFATVSSADNIVESPEKFTAVNESNMAYSEQDNYEDDEEGSYQALRKSVQEHRNTMKEYYKAATEAFQQGDQVRANKLLEKGCFFQQKAREADDESAKKIFETSKSMDTEDSISLNLNECEPREATKLLKRHISSLAGNLGFKYLKVIIETADEDTSKGARRRRIMRLLDRDSIKWTEEGTAGTILIPLEIINRRNLSFAKK